MVSRKELESFLKSVDKAIKIEACRKNSFELEFSDEGYYDLKPKMEDAFKVRLDIRRVEKGAKRNIVFFEISKKSPADEILDIFSKYYEGTKPASGEED